MSDSVYKVYGLSSSSMSLVCFCCFLVGSWVFGTAICAEQMVNMYVFIRFHFSSEMYFCCVSEEGLAPHFERFLVTLDDILVSFECTGGEIEFR